MAKKNLAYGTGRRKTAVARVFLREGSGKITVNDKTPEEYFPTVLMAQNITNEAFTMFTDNVNETWSTTLVNNAGVFKSTPILDITACEWDMIMKVNRGK